MTNLNTISNPKSATTHLQPNIWKHINQKLVCKAISEFAHELILKPVLQDTIKQWGIYIIVSDIPGIIYEFKAQKHSLDHWHVDPDSIIKIQQGTSVTVDAFQFIMEFKYSLGIPEELLPNYLEEITSTLSSAAYKYANEQYSSADLVDQKFQTIEHAMTEGHPCFVANNGRIGFDAQEYLKYAPEANAPFQILWVAGHKSKATFAGVKGFEYNAVMRKELGLNTVAKFNTILDGLGMAMESYVFIPVHPWQWYNKLVHVFAADIADRDLVFLGYGEDKYSAQQSIRTLYNISHPEKMYTKTALSILNMGFMRGLSPYYMESTPAITDWITALLAEDAYIQKNGFTMLGEVATVGYRNLNYEPLGKSSPHTKMLAALWRESPHTKYTSNQELMTMAAFLHIDNQGESLLTHLIKVSPFDTTVWLQKYLNCYLSPLLHCFYTYGMAFMPHGENLIIVMENNTPVKVLMKDITEEVIVFDATLALPKQVERLYTEASDDMKALVIFTDVFDCFFRFMASILRTHSGYAEAHFWELVAACIHTYQAEHPEMASKYEQYDFFTPEFGRCCLNRLQLRNTKQMLDLADPIESLQLEGTLKNPLAPYRDMVVNLFPASIV